MSLRCMKELVTHFVKNNLVPDSQYGFRSLRSTLTFLLTGTLEDIKNGKGVDVV